MQDPAPTRGRELPARQLRAAGGVLWRRAPDGRCQLAVVHRPRYDDWSLPKGKPNGDEHPVQTAVREVWEETGQRAVVGRPLGTSSYPVVLGGKEATKTVRWFAMEAVGEGPVTGHDVDEVRWLTPAATQDLLTHARDRDVLTRFLRGPLAPPLALLVRHGEAGRSDPSRADDDIRPLDPVGRCQAQELAPVLVAFAPTRIVSAPVLRCRQTLAPLAALLGRTIDVEPVLGEAHHVDHPGHAAEWLRGTAHYPSIVLCSQGAVIRDVLHDLTATRDQPSTPKASSWLLAFDGRQLLSADLVS